MSTTDPIADLLTRIRNANQKAFEKLEVLALQVQGADRADPTSGGEKLRVYFRLRGGRFTEVFLEGGADVVYEGRTWEEPAAPAKAKRPGRKGR